MLQTRKDILLLYVCDYEGVSVPCLGDGRNLLLYTCVPRNMAQAHHCLMTEEQTVKGAGAATRDSQLKLQVLSITAPALPLRTGSDGHVSVQPLQRAPLAHPMAHRGA